MDQIKYDVFISYSRKDTDTANKITQCLDEAGITYFIDRQGIGGGMEFPAVLSKAIRESKIFLFLASKNSYESKFTQSEIVYAFNKKEKNDIIPYIIDGSSLPDELEFTFSSINWRRIEQHPIETTLINDILQKLGKPLRTEKPVSPSASEPDTAKKSKFTGKTLAKIILGYSIVLFVGAIVFAIVGINNQEAFRLVYSLSMFVLFIFLLIGYIRPSSLDLASRKEVTKFYLVTFAVIFIATCILVGATTS